MIRFKYRYAPFLLIAFLIIVFSIFYFSRPAPENNLNIEFKGKITKINKQYRGRYDISLQTNEYALIIIDNHFGNYIDKIKIGDSAIKSKNTNCFFYKKDTTLFENCFDTKIILP